MKLHFTEKILFLFLAVLFVSGVAGFSYAYFTGGVKFTGDGANVDAKTADLIKVEYNAGTESLDFDNAYPGNEKTKDFTISLTPTESENTATYKIKLVINSNTFKKCTEALKTTSNDCVLDAKELVVTLTEEGGTESEEYDITGLNSGDILELGTFTKTTDAEKDYNYTLKVKYKDTNADQNHNEGATLAASLKVEF